MVRTLALVSALALSGTTVWARGVPPDGDDARYTLGRVEDGYLRLDGRTGQVSHCIRQPVGWACRALPDDRVALEAEIARLQKENVVLKKELIAHNLPLPNSKQGQAPEEPRLRLPGDADVNKLMSFLEKVWRRLVEMVGNLQKDLLKKS